MFILWCAKHTTIHVLRLQICTFAVSVSVCSIRKVVCAWDFFWEVEVWRDYNLVAYAYITWLHCILCTRLWAWNVCMIVTIHAHSWCCDNDNNGYMCERVKKIEMRWVELTLWVLPEMEWHILISENICCRTIMLIH